MKIKRIYISSNKTVTIAGDSCKVENLKRCSALDEAGLEIKTITKQNPRIIVHDIPVEYTSGDIQSSLVKQNFLDHSIEDFKIVYMYPDRDKKVYRFCVIETTPQLKLFASRLNMKFT